MISIIDYIDPFDYDINKIFESALFRPIIRCYDFGSSESEQVSSTKSPTQQKWLNQALAIYGPQLGQGENIYQGERVAGFNPIQEQALDVQGFLDQFSPYKEIPMFGETGTALSGILSGTTGAQPYSSRQAEELFADIYQKPAEKYFQEETLPAIREAYSGPGFWSTTRAKAQMEGAQDLADVLSAERGQFLWDVEQQNRALEEAKAERALSAISPALEYGATPTREATERLAGRAGVFEFAGAEQAQRQAEINEAIQRFAEENRITSSEDMQIILSLLGMDYGSASGSSTGAGLGTIALGSLLGGFGTGFGKSAGASIFTKGAGG